MKKEQRRDTKEKEEESLSFDTVYISTLLNCLLCYIISFFSTRDVVITGILLSKWRVVWTFVPILDLDQGELSKTCVDKTFSLGGIVSLCGCNTVPNSVTIQKLHIHWFTDCLPFHAHRWICANIQHGLPIEIHTLLKAIMILKSDYGKLCLLINILLVA